MKISGFLVALFTLVMLSNGCRKAEHLVQLPRDNTAIDAFLSLPANADPVLFRITNKGGQAVKQTPVIARPNWRNIDKYLRGQITFTQLKQMLGCY